MEKFISRDDMAPYLRGAIILFLQEDACLWRLSSMVAVFCREGELSLPPNLSKYDSLSIDKFIGSV